MFKMILSFLLVFGLVAGCIEIFRKLTNREKLDLAKLFLYSVGVSVVTFAILVFIVVIF